MPSLITFVRKHVIDSQESLTIKVLEELDTIHGKDHIFVCKGNNFGRFFELNIQIASSKNFLKISFDKNISKIISTNSTQYFLDLQHMSQIIPILRYKIVVDINETIFQLILIISQWKHTMREIYSYYNIQRKHTFFHSESTLALHDLGFIVEPKNIMIKTLLKK
ncbi:hypothetical protein MERGE_002503 [Pneumocystis wakefieldiae]|uniref:Uncharacterized protein n=1 Tax=Pneumocystis wakefieldiae TaxID=38082 RepID=A0A899FXK3_9ASCO|nr:hypothetical protein MERGE_002503 [Pneumocystis wakefieldiae]